MCIVPGANGVGFRFGTNYDEMYIKNCTFIGGTHGVSESGDPDTLTTVQNCVAYGQSTAGFDEGIGTWGTFEYCASADTSATGTGAVTGITSTDFVDYAGGNYAAKIGGALAGAGTDLSANFDDDITGTPR